MTYISRRRFLGNVAGFSLAATAPHFLSMSSRAFAAEPNDDDPLRPAT